MLEEENSKSKLELDPEADADQKFLQEAMNVLNDVKKTKQEGEANAADPEKAALAESEIMQKREQMNKLFE